jgi:hypothetical protein
MNRDIDAMTKDGGRTSGRKNHGKEKERGKGNARDQIWFLHWPVRGLRTTNGVGAGTSLRPVDRRDRAPPALPLKMWTTTTKTMKEN